MRLLDSTYTGSAIRVRRSSDNTEQDIGFNVFGELDTVSLLDFAGTGDAFCKVWYDQSGSSNDATQTATGSQPQIVSSGAVIVENGKPAVDLDGVNDNLVVSSIALNAYFSTSLVLKPDVAGGFLLEHSSNSNNADGFYLQGTTGETFNLRRTVRDRYNAAAGWVGTNQTLVTLNSDGTPTLHKDGTAITLTPVSVGGVANTSVTTELNLFSRNSSSIFYNGKAQEVIIYNTDQSGNRTNIESNIATFYDITI